MAPLPYSDSGASVLRGPGRLRVLEPRIRLKSRLNRDGASEDRGALLIVIVAVAAGVVGGFVASDTPDVLFEA